MTTIELIKEAITALKDRTGSSIVAITKYIESEKKQNVKKHIMKAALKRGVETGTLIQVKNSYKVSAESKKKLTKPTVAKTKVVKKTEKTAPPKKKVSAAKKETSTKKKVSIAAATKTKAVVKKATSIKKKASSPKKKTAPKEKVATKKQ